MYYFVGVRLHWTLSVNFSEEQSLVLIPGEGLSSFGNYFSSLFSLAFSLLYQWQLPSNYQLLKLILYPTFNSVLVFYAMSVYYYYYCHSNFCAMTA